MNESSPSNQPTPTRTHLPVSALFVCVSWYRSGPGPARGSHYSPTAKFRLLASVLAALACLPAPLHRRTTCSMAVEQIVFTRLEHALLRTFADQGPSPTAFGACPGAAFTCNGRAHRSAPGWWAIFSCDTTISCNETMTAGGTRAEQAELRFVPSGAGVMDGVVWTWQLTSLRTAGQARLFVQDSAPYPNPMTNLLAYHALVISRDALSARVAHLLGAWPVLKAAKPSPAAAATAPHGRSAALHS